MKRIAIIVAAVLLGNVVSAQADQSIFHWYDTFGRTVTNAATLSVKPM